MIKTRGGHQFDIAGINLVQKIISKLAKKVSWAFQAKIISFGLDLDIVLKIRELHIQKFQLITKINSINASQVQLNTIISLYK